MLTASSAQLPAEFIARPTTCSQTKEQYFLFLPAVVRRASLDLDSDRRGPSDLWFTPNNWQSVNYYMNYIHDPTNAICSRKAPITKTKNTPSRPSSKEWWDCTGNKSTWCYPVTLIWQGGSRLNSSASSWPKVNVFWQPFSPPLHEAVSGETLQPVWPLIREAEIHWPSVSFAASPLTENRWS